MNRIILCYLLLILISISAIGSGTVHADDVPAPPAGYDGLDIIFLVDQSGSMGGASYGFAPAGQGYDPLGLRFEAVQYALMMLGQYRLSIAPDVQMRLSVVNFGDEAAIVDEAADWIMIAPTGQAVEWDATFEQIAAILSADSFRERHNPPNLGNTNFFAAFDAARLKFAELPQSGDRYLRAVVLLTDGAPCVPQQFDCDDFAAQKRHMQNVIELTEAAFPAPDYAVYVLTLDVTGSLWDIWRSDWQVVTRVPERTTLATDSQQVGIRFLDILLELMSLIRGTDEQSLNVLQVGENHVFVPPYLAEIRLSVFKSSRDPGLLEIVSPGGSLLPETDPRVSIRNRDRPIEIWTINNPQPGDWVFTVSEAQTQMDVYMEFIPVDVNLQVTADEYYQYDSVPLSFNLLDSQGQPLLIYADPYGLDVTVDIASPNGEILSMPATLQHDGAYHASVFVDQRGTYTVSVSAVSTVPSGETYIILQRQQAVTFEVTGVVLDANLPEGEFLSGSVYELEITLSDENDEPLNVEQTLITLELTHNGVPETYQLTSIDNRTFNHPLELDSAGAYTLNISAQISYPDGRTMSAGQPLATAFSVIPSQRLYLELITPTTTTFRQATTTGFPPITPSEFDLVFAVVDENGSPVDLARIADAGEVAWEMQALQDGQPLPPTELPAVSSVPNIPGHYRAAFGALQVGDYDITIVVQTDLTGAYVFDPAGSRISLSLSRVVSWLYYLTIGSGILIIALAATGLALRIRLRINRRRHPARGKLIIREVGSEVQVWSADLDAQRSNHIVYRDRKLRQIGINKMTVTCTDGRMSQLRRVRVIVQIGKDHIDRLLSPGTAPVRLSKNMLGLDLPEEGRTSYELVKDPDDLGYW